MTLISANDLHALSAAHRAQTADTYSDTRRCHRDRQDASGERGVGRELSSADQGRERA